MPKKQSPAKELNCSLCGLYKSCNSPRLSQQGNFKKRILVVAEQPSEADDKSSKPFQDKSGRLLQRLLKNNGIDLFEDCLITFSLRCHAGDDYKNVNLDCCRRLLLSTIKQYKPHLILAFGPSTIYSLIGDRIKKDLGTIQQWRGFQIPDQDLNAFICPLYSPDFIDTYKDDVGYTLWESDLKSALKCLEQPFPVFQTPEIDIIDDLSVLNGIKDNIAIDFETTGIKPHGKGHRIISCAIADTKDHAYAFILPQTRKDLRPLLNLFEDENVGKIGHNIKFEQMWSEVTLRQSINNWIHDTMLTTHLLDNRPRITGLKFQTYVNFGVIDYASEVEAWIKTKNSNSTNDMNNIMEFIMQPGGLDKLLTYNGWDSVCTYRLYEKQYVEFLPF